jgi:SAM-dependent methyltransferase
MTYSDYTFRDKSCLKRCLQHRRLTDALRHFPASAARVLDFGAGDGELCRRIAAARPSTFVTCYEPSATLFREAQIVTKGQPNVLVTRSLQDIPCMSQDVIYCLEVFEHLPQRQTSEALDAIHGLLRAGGTLIVGIPIEIGPPAFFKGLFRMARRYGEFDARPSNIFRAMMASPPENRPEIALDGNLPFYPHHLGFDHRRLVERVSRYFLLSTVSCSPFPAFGPIANSEIYIVATKQAGRP